MFGKKNRYKKMQNFNVEQVGNDLNRLRHQNLNASYDAADELVEYLNSGNNLQKIYTQMRPYAFNVGDHVTDKGLYERCAKIPLRNPYHVQDAIDGIGDDLKRGILRADMRVITRVDINSLFAPLEIARHLQYESWTTLVGFLFVYDTQMINESTRRKINGVHGHMLVKM